MGERGIYNTSSARFKRNAIEQFVTVFGPEEPRTAIYLRDELDSISNRWTTKEKANPETGRTYKSRVSTAIKDYLRYQENPQGFKVKPSSTPKKASKKSDKPAAQASKPVEPTPPSAEARPPITATPSLRNFPLGKDREPFIYALPDGMTVADVAKIACHLVTLATDFDPMSPKTAAVFSLARRDD